jgi:transcriptional repressor NrdR
MHCPYCNKEDTKVIDSRLVQSGRQVRRRRECVSCGSRMTTYEVVEFNLPRVLKQDGSSVVFDENKLRSGFLKALEKRPVSFDQVNAAIHSIVDVLSSLGEREVASSVIGDLVMKSLLALDKVAYIRFASVYYSFEDLAAFHDEIKRLQGESNA